MPLLIGFLTFIGRRSRAISLSRPSFGRKMMSTFLPAGYVTGIVKGMQFRVDLEEIGEDFAPMEGEMEDLLVANAKYLGLEVE